jgi:hypothetical protein
VGRLLSDGRDDLGGQGDAFAADSDPGSVTMARSASAQPQNEQARPCGSGLPVLRPWRRDRGGGGIRSLSSLLTRVGSTPMSSRTRRADEPGSRASTNSTCSVRARLWPRLVASRRALSTASSASPPPMTWSPASRLSNSDPHFSAAVKKRPLGSHYRLAKDLLSVSTLSPVEGDQLDATNSQVKYTTPHAGGSIGLDHRRVQRARCGAPGGGRPVSPVRPSPVTPPRSTDLGT